MEQKNFMRNVSGTACILGFVLSAMSINSTMVVNGDYEIQKADYSCKEISSTDSLSVDVSNIYEIKSSTRLEKVTNMIFGEMRDATPEEQESINNYIKSISRNTGVNFFDLC